MESSVHAGASRWRLHSPKEPIEFLAERFELGSVSVRKRAGGYSFETAFGLLAQLANRTLFQFGVVFPGASRGFEGFCRHRMSFSSAASVKKLLRRREPTKQSMSSLTSFSSRTTWV